MASINMNEWLVVHLSSGEVVRSEFTSENEAYAWLKSACESGELQPANLEEYAVEKLEEEDID